MRMRFEFIAACIAFILVVSCDKHNNDVSATIVGTWVGTKSDFKINPSGIIPPFTINRDTLPVKLEFKSDGNLLLTDNKQSVPGTYQLSGTKLTINITYTFELIDLAGTYTVEELTNSTLRASTEKTGTYTHPDTGMKFDGTVKATLNFSRQAH